MTDKISLAGVDLDAIKQRLRAICRRTDSPLHDKSAQVDALLDASAELVFGDIPSLIGALERSEAENVRLRARLREQEECCIVAAIITANGTIIRGQRHDQCFHIAASMGLLTTTSRHAQGFITSRNRYVEREEGLKLQLAAGIASVSPDGYRPPNLYSQDLYIASAGLAEPKDLGGEAIPPDTQLETAHGITTSDRVVRPRGDREPLGQPKDVGHVVCSRCGWVECECIVLDSELAVAPPDPPMNYPMVVLHPSANGSNVCPFCNQQVPMKHRCLMAPEVGGGSALLPETEK